VSEFTEVADRVWVARYEWCDVNITVVEGEAGLLVVDTHGSSVAAREVVADIRRLSARPVVGVVNTHEHFDHVFGNAVFREEWVGVPITAHETAAANTVPEGELVKQAARERKGRRSAQMAQTPLVAADHTFSSVTTIGLGDRAVDLVHPGRGHTGGDLVVRLDDVDVLLAGDLVEESGHPAYGSDSFPLEWPWSLDLVLELVGPGTVVVPGHGAPVGRDFVQDQRSAIGVVAQTIRDLAGSGVSADQALGSTQWPYPAEHLVEAVRRGYDHLPASAKRLPLA
jgi:glyoxylase-like metal-dependent hydrolase (beta-lactamase superfamily II)